MKTRHSRQQTYGWTKALCAVVALFLLLLVAHAASAQKAPDKGALLGATHKAAGIECSQCHKEKPSAPVPTAVCQGCHKDIAKSATTKGGLHNPHDAHMSYPDCAECHHVHKPSENQCAGCHDFKYRMR